jgi:TrmH family RNA methyltransferase
MIHTITSRTNTLIKRYAQLKDAHYRAESNLFIAEGLRSCETLMKAGVPLEHLLYTTHNEHAIQPLFPAQASIRITTQIAEKLSSVDNPSGIIGIFHIPPIPDPTEITPGLVLANITNPGNMGTLIRTAAAMGVKSVVAVEGCDPWSHKVIQASAGTIGLVRLFQWYWQELVDTADSIPLCALVVSGGKKPDQLALNSMLLVIGNEAHGIPIEWLSDCSQQVTLPMSGDTESFNAAVAGSIALYLGYSRVK